MSENIFDYLPKNQKPNKPQEGFIAPDLLDVTIDVNVSKILGKILPIGTTYRESSTISKQVSQRIATALSSQEITKISQVETQGFYLIIKHIDSQGQEKTISFDLTPRQGKNNDFIGSLSKEEIQEQEEHKREIILKENETLRNVLHAMEHVFQKNNQEFWRKFTKADKVSSTEFDTPELKLSGKNIFELQKLASEKIPEIKLARMTIFDAEIPSDILMQENFETYLGYIVGIGDFSDTQTSADDYESGAEYLNKNQAEMDFLISEVVNSTKGIQELLEKLQTIHGKINSNDYQSTTVEKNYKYFIDNLSVSIFQKMKQDKQATDKDFLNFARIVSGRGIQINESKGDIDSRLYNPQLANMALIYVMSPKDGIIEKISSKVTIEDELVGKKTASQVLKESAKSLTERMKMPNGDPVDGNNILQQLNFGDLETKNTPYGELSYGDKVRVSTLARLIEKLEKQHFNYDPMSPESYSIGLITYRLSDLPDLFKEIAQDAASDVSENMKDAIDWTWGEANGKGLIHADGMNSKEIGLEPGSIEADIYDTFRDINGVGDIWEWSDESQGYLKDALYMATIVAGAMALGTIVIMTAPISGLVAAGTVGNIFVQGGIYGASASVSSWGADYVMGDAKGYATPLEAGVNIGSDLAVGTITGVFGGYLVNKWGTEAAFLARESLRNKGIFAGDLVFLGIGPEAGRMWIMDQVFHSEEIFEKENINSRF